VPYARNILSARAYPSSTHTLRSMPSSTLTRMTPTLIFHQAAAAALRKIAAAGGISLDAAFEAEVVRSAGTAVTYEVLSDEGLKVRLCETVVSRSSCLAPLSLLSRGQADIVSSLSSLSNMRVRLVAPHHHHTRTLVHRCVHAGACMASRWPDHAIYTPLSSLPNRPPRATGPRLCQGAAPRVAKAARCRRRSHGGESLLAGRAAQAAFRNRCS
jgi:hypothetical protein